MACGQVSMQLGSGRPVYSVGFNPAQHGLIAAGGGAKMLHPAHICTGIRAHSIHLCNRSWAHAAHFCAEHWVSSACGSAVPHSLLGLLSRRSRRRCQGVAIEQPPIQSGRHSPLGHAMPYESTSPSHPDHRAWAVSVPLSCPKRPQATRPLAPSPAEAHCSTSLAIAG